jgi:hypothetical protein
MSNEPKKYHIRAGLYVLQDTNATAILKIEEDNDGRWMFCEDYEKLKKQLEWQPIETAPKDGTWILVYKKLELNGFNKIVWETDKFIVRWHNNGWYKNNGLFTVDNVTHWINLPKTPEL